MFAPGAQGSVPAASLGSRWFSRCPLVLSVTDCFLRARCYSWCTIVPSIIHPLCQFSRYSAFALRANRPRPVDPLLDWRDLVVKRPEAVRGSVQAPLGWLVPARAVWL